MDSFFNFIDLIKTECSSLLMIMPLYVSVCIVAALGFIVILGVMRIWALVLDDVPFI